MQRAFMVTGRGGYIAFGGLKKRSLFESDYPAIYRVLPLSRSLWSHEILFETSSKDRDAVSRDINE